MKPAPLCDGIDGRDSQRRIAASGVRVVGEHIDSSHGIFTSRARIVVGRRSVVNSGDADGHRAGIADGSVNVGDRVGNNHILKDREESTDADREERIDDICGRFEWAHESLFTSPEKSDVEDETEEFFSDLASLHELLELIG